MTVISILFPLFAFCVKSLFVILMQKTKRDRAEGGTDTDRQRHTETDRDTQRHTETHRDGRD